MAIVKSFGGSSIRKPGAFSTISVDNSAGAPLGSNDVLLLVGESTQGAPGDVSGITSFTAENLSVLTKTYGSGPIVDCAVSAIRPSVSTGIGGAGKILVWKTNSSVQAAVTLLQTASNMFVVKGKAWGVDDNKLSVVVANGTGGAQKLITVTKLGGVTESLGENLDETLINIQYTGNGTSATMSIAGASRNAHVLTTTLAGQSDGSVNLSINLNTVTIKQLVDSINASTGYVATIGVASKSNNSATDLDVVSAVNIKTASVAFKRTQLEILDLLNTSTRISATESPAILGGVPDNVTAPLTGGLQGASLPSDFSDGFSNSLAEDYSVVLPAISRDASVDFADTKLGFTDVASTYTISAVLTAMGAHLTTRGNVKNHKEAQGMGGVRDIVKATAFTTISTLNDSNIQAGIQDVLFLDATGVIRVGQPHILMAMLAGIRLGTSIGEPLTNKFIRATGIGHFIDPTTGFSTGDFKPANDADTAIDNGVIFVEKRNGGFRVSIDNTSYGVDSSFVFNRGSVIEAAYFVSRTIRQLAEDLFIGKKVSNGIAESIKSAIRNKLRELNQPDVQIITSSDDAPEGFREDTFVVSVVGNTANVSVEIKPVQSLDWVFIAFSLGDVKQTA